MSILKTIMSRILGTTATAGAPPAGTPPMDGGSAPLAAVPDSAPDAPGHPGAATVDVAAILAQFPGSRITDVRIRVTEDEIDEGDIVPPAAAESAEGDILPGDDIEL